MTASPNSFPAEGVNTPEQLKALAAHLLESEALGRSTRMFRLFQYLVDCSIAGRAPKETEVAIDVFGKSPSFDVGQDAMVRVYVHKLRKRIEEHYARTGNVDGLRLIVPKKVGYRIEVVQESDRPADPPPEVTIESPQAIEGTDLTMGVPTSQLRRRSYAFPALATALALSLLINAIVTLRAYWDTHPSRDSIAAATAHPVWSRLLEGDRTIYLVLGDYYMFGEADAKMRIQRLVRDSSVNSPHDLTDYLKLHPEMEGRYRDIRANYLPTSTAYALREVLPLLSPAIDRVRIEMASDLTPDMIATSDVIYIGYLNGLGMLGNVLSTGSRFSVASTSDEIIDHDTGIHYISQAAIPLPGDQKYRDFGYFATFAGPRGNQTIVIAGTRDEGVMHTADAATHRASLDQLNSDRGARSFEALYDVLSLDGKDLDGKLLFTSTLDVSKIWSGESLVDGPTAPSIAEISRIPSPAALVDAMARDKL